MNTPQKLERFVVGLIVLVSTTAYCQRLQAQIEQAPGTNLEAQAFAKSVETKISFDFKDEPLKDVAIKLGDLAEVNVLLDLRALEEIGIDGSRRVTAKLDNVSLRSAVRFIVSEMDPAASFDFRDQAVTISTYEALESLLVWRAYDIRDLMLNRDLRLKRKPAIRHFYETKRDPTPADAIVELVSTTIEPGYWAEVGGSGDILPFDTWLYITQTERIHEKVDSLLAGLKKLKADQAAGTLQPWQLQGYVDQKDFLLAQRIVSLMDKRISFDFDDEPLVDVVVKLSRKLGVNVKLSMRSLEEVGIGNDTPVTFRVKELQARPALRRLLDSIDPELTHQFDESGEIMWITIKESAESNLSTRIYPMADLLGLGRDQLSDLITRLVEPENWEEVGGVGSLAFFEPCQALVVSQEHRLQPEVYGFIKNVRERHRQSIQSATALPAARVNDAYIGIYHLAVGKDREAVAQLATSVRDVVEPTAWNDGKKIHHLPDRLIIRQRDEVHQKVHAYLVQLEMLKVRGPNDPR